MIVLPEDDIESGTPTERTPLKSPSGPQSPQYSLSPAPPPYTPSSPTSASQAAWRPGPPLHPSHGGGNPPLSPILPTTYIPQSTTGRQRSDTPGRRALHRILKAWVLAWVVICLWSMLVGSVTITIKDFQRDTPPQLLYKWWQGNLIGVSIPNAPKPASGEGGGCTCPGTPISTVPAIPISTPSLRPLPIDYPPVVLTAMKHAPEDDLEERKTI